MSEEENDIGAEGCIFLARANWPNLKKINLYAMFYRGMELAQG